jgi:hypothetical protein
MKKRFANKFSSTDCTHMCRRKLGEVGFANLYLSVECIPADSEGVNTGGLLGEGCCSLPTDTFQTPTGLGGYCLHASPQ